ncbi:hypothetical protein GW17_00061318 [Ensete ventricosum]|nr:hypothetical protein GW17_00061318 [Ensete ventricosum]RZS05151.1 hypothetical protein BHM03_00035605 [Ensete ventricosum]
MDAAWLEEICVNWGLISVEEGEISCCRGRRGLSSLREGYAAGRRRRRRGWEAAPQVETSTAAVAEGHQNKGAPLFLALGGWWQRGATGRWMQRRWRRWLCVEDHAVGKRRRSRDWDVHYWEETPATSSPARAEEDGSRGTLVREDRKL